MRIGTGVNLRRLGVSLAADLLHSAVSVGLDFVQVALALACDARGLTLPLRTKALCNLESLADHALVDAVQDIGVVVYSLDPEIEYGDAKLCQFLRRGCFDFILDLLPAEEQATARARIASSAQGSLIGPPGWGESYDFIAIAHNLIALLAGCLGGVTARLARGRQAAPSGDDTPREQ